MKIIALITALLMGIPAFAHEAGTWIVRAGPAQVSPNDDSDAIDVAGLVTLPGVNVDDNTQLGITGTYMLGDRFGVELLVATPFTHDISLKDLGVKAGETRQLPPTLMFQFYPMDNASRFQPYLGAGINTTIFFDEEVDDELNLALDGIVGLPAGTVDADLDLDQSWGWSVQVGFDYMVGKNWLVNAAIWYTDIDTEAKISTAIADVKFDVDIDPYVYILSIGYKF